MLRCRDRVDSYPGRRPLAGRTFSVTVELAVSLAGILTLTRSWRSGLSILTQRGSELIDTLLLLPHALHGARRSLPVEAGGATAAAGRRGERRHCVERRFRGGLAAKLLAPTGLQQPLNKTARARTVGAVLKAGTSSAPMSPQTSSYTRRVPSRTRPPPHVGGVANAHRQVRHDSPPRAYA